MGALTNYLEDELIKHIFRTGSMTKPTNLYVALFTGAPGEASGGTEVSGGSYARVGVAVGDATWAATAGGNATTSNVNAINFPTPAAGWGLITHWAIFDASSGGNMLFYAPLTQSKTIDPGDNVSFPAGTLTVQIDN